MQATPARVRRDGDPQLPLWPDVRVRADEAARDGALGAIVAALVPPRMRGPLLVSLARVGAGESQAAFAARVGLSRGQVARIEAGKVILSPERAALLEAYTGLPAALLVAPEASDG